MEQLREDKLRAYSVWVPILLTDAERSVSNATKRLPDNRVMHFWDGKGELVEAYKAILPTKNAQTGEYVKAWDVYLRNIWRILYLQALKPMSLCLA